MAVFLGACAPGVAPRVATPGSDGPVVRPSPGCAAGAAAIVPDRLVVAGRGRSLLTDLPQGRAARPRDLVIAFHGRTNDAREARGYFGLDEALPHAIVIYPQALPAGSAGFAWSDPGDAPERLRDFAFVAAIVEAVGQARCVDLERVFVVGHSLGAYFANEVACRLGDRVRGVASVAGGVRTGACSGGAAALLVHHPADPLVSIHAGEAARDAFLAANGLAGAPAVAATGGALAPLRCVRHGEPTAADPVVWCARDDASHPPGRSDPHTWPDGAAAAIAAFFEGLPRAQDTAGAAAATVATIAPP